MPLRYMQREAVDAVFQYWAESDGNCLVDMAGGSGKSMTMATLAKECMDGWDLRVLNVAHREELVEGNFKEFIGIAPFAAAGIYAASLGRRDARSQIVFGQIQTIYNKAQEIGHVDLLEIDEVHLCPEFKMDIAEDDRDRPAPGPLVISDDETAQYGQLIRELLAINPDMKIVGFSATIYRTNSGRLDEGEGRMWDKCVYTYTLAQGIEDGYLCPISSKATAGSFDLSGVGTLGGDFKKGQLQSAVDKHELTVAIVAEAIATFDREGKKTTLWFGSGVEHALHMRDEIRKAGRTCETLTGKTKKGERRKIINDMKSGKLYACTNDAVLTVGTNIPAIDGIADLGPTKSCNRFVQKIVRGSRPLYQRGFDPDGEGVTAEDRRNAIANGPKPSCLYLDFSRNTEYHGPVDTAQPRPVGSGQGSPPIKQCPHDRADETGKFGCDELIAISIMTCPNCGYIFPPSVEEKLTRAPSTTPILSTEKPWYTIVGRTFAHNPAKSPEKPPTVKTTYEIEGGRIVNEWLCPEHTAFPKPKADKFWALHRGARPFPATVDGFLDRAGELLATTEVQLSFEKSSKYPEIVAYRAGEGSYVTERETRAIDAPDTPVEGVKLGNLGRLASVRTSVAESGTERADAKERARLAALAFDMDIIPF